MFDVVNTTFFLLLVRVRRGSTNDKFTSVRMVERKFLSRFLSVLPPEVNSCHCIRSYYITDAESRLLNEINLKSVKGEKIACTV